MKKAVASLSPKTRPRKPSVKVADKGNSSDSEYENYLRLFMERFQRVLLREGVFSAAFRPSQPLFQTDVSPELLWDYYLAGFTRSQRQYHNCNACRRFIQRYGGLVIIDPETGRAKSAVWDIPLAPRLYRKSVANMLNAIEAAKVISPFLSGETVWGQPVTGNWKHFALIPPTNALFKHPVLSAEQRMAEMRGEYRTLSQALVEFPPILLKQAQAVLDTDQLYRSEKVEGVLRWLSELHSARSKVSGAQAKRNLTWLAAAKAPPGFCHVRSTVAGTLLEDLLSGKSFELVKRNFDSKMHPLQYQRPVAAPKAGNIVAAEKLVAKLYAEGALERRFALPAECPKIWVQRLTPHLERSQPQPGIFSNVRPRNEAVRVDGLRVVLLDPTPITWAKFSSKVLPDAERIAVKTPLHAGPFAALVTARDKHAPPIIQWDSETARNPVSWYLWAGGSLATQWGLQCSAYFEVDFITMAPHTWKGVKYTHFKNFALFVIKGARETRNAGICLFPEILKSEFHPIRATIEAYSRHGNLSGIHGPQVAGLMFEEGAGAQPLNLQVTSRGVVQHYILDRWE